MEQQVKRIEQIKQQGFLPLFYHDDSETCLEVVRALYQAGVKIIEFTNRGPNALENFTALVSARDASMTDLILAAGTIKSSDDASRFIKAGADILISPVFDADVADVAYLHKILWIPGCMTPTEIHVAEKSGCKLVKIFPGNILGPAFISSIKELFPAMDFMPTGGVELDSVNLKAWFQSGVCAVGMGSKLISKEKLDNRQYAIIGKLAQQALHIVNEVRSRI